jgi:hypothetical protein
MDDPRKISGIAGDIHSGFFAQRRFSVEKLNIAIIRDAVIPGVSLRA